MEWAKNRFEEIEKRLDRIEERLERLEREKNSMEGCLVNLCGAGSPEILSSTFVDRACGPYTPYPYK